LDKIPTSIPLDIFPKDKIATEIAMDGFLFYANGSLDLVFAEINKKLNLGLLPNQIHPLDILKALEEKHTDEAKAMIEEFQKYFQKPIHEEKIISDQEFNDGLNRYGYDIIGFHAEYESRGQVKYQHFWNRVSSRLWEIRNQQNLESYDSLLKNAGKRGKDKPRNYLRVKISDDDHPSVFWDSAHYENPKRYYTNILSLVKQFIDRMLEVLKSQYPPDSNLEQK
jgi:ribosomal protein L31E